MNFSLSSKMMLRAALMWPKVTMYLVKQIGKAPAGMQTGLEVLAVLPALGGALIGYALSGPEPVLNLLTFYAGAGGLTAFLPQIANLLKSGSGLVIEGDIVAALTPPSAAPAVNIAGPTTRNKYNTASRYDKNFDLPRYPFVAGQQYALQNDGGTTWLQTKKAVHSY